MFFQRFSTNIGISLKANSNVCNFNVNGIIFAIASVYSTEMFKTLLFLFIGISTLHYPTQLQKDIIDGLAQNFKAGNSKDIGKSFAPSLELILLDEEDVYSKAQGEQIIKDFFVKYPPTKAVVIHKINNNQNYKFGVLTLSTAKGAFRISITLKKIDKDFLVTELRIEPAKEE